MIKYFSSSSQFTLNWNSRPWRNCLYSTVQYFPGTFIQSKWPAETFRFVCQKNVSIYMSYITYLYVFVKGMYIYIYVCVNIIFIITSKALIPGGCRRIHEWSNTPSICTMFTVTVLCRYVPSDQDARHPSAKGGGQVDGEEDHVWSLW